MNSDKAQLRKKMRQSLQSIDPSEKQSYDHALIEKARTLILKYRPNWVGLFAPRSYEPNLIPLMAMMPSQKWAFPKVVGSSLCFYETRYFSELAPGYSGLLEPQGETQVMWHSKDIVFLPGLAFDSKGYRLGSGKGFFDRYLSQLHPRPRCVGVAYSFQLVTETIPWEPTDVPMDEVVLSL